MPNPHFNMTLSNPPSCLFPQNPKLRTYSKVCFALGGVPYQMTENVIGFYLPIFLLDIVQIWSLWLQLEAWEVSLVQFVGRAWDAITDPTVGFLVSRSPRTRLGRFIPWIVFSTPFAVVFYFLLWFTPYFGSCGSCKVGWYLIFYCLFKMVLHVPYSSLTMFLSHKTEERDSATAYRTLFPLKTSQQQNFGGSFPEEPSGHLVLGLYRDRKRSMHGFKQVSKPSEMSEHQEYVTIWQIFVLAFLQWWIPFLIALVTVPRNVPLAFVVCAACGVTVATTSLIPWSMLPDTIMDFKKKYGDYPGQEALFYSFYVFFNKFAVGICLALSMLILDSVGYKTCKDNTRSLVLTLRLLMAPAPIIFGLIGISALICYKL
uniref:Si:ch211-224l10.4 n=1 Tax=Eptatretus burgeri TaxID=7764 RepID=A0A8C4N629_EPTBU